MSILISWLAPLRAICIAIDGVAYNLLDQAYNIVVELSSATILEHVTIKKIMSSIYILFGVVAFFRLALVLVNAILDPEKLNEKGKGVSNIFFRVVGMIVILAVTPWLFEQSYKIQKRIVSSKINENIIFSLILGDKSNIGGYDKNGYNAGKALQNVVLSSLITIDDRYLVKDGAVCSINNKGQYVDSNDNIIPDKEVNTSCGFIPLTCVPNSDGKTCNMQGGYIYGEKCDWKNCRNAVSKYNIMYVNEDMHPSSLAGSVGVSKKIPVKDVNGETVEEEVYVYDYMIIITTIAGIAMTWIILSFAIDIAVRMFELVVLEVLSPLFIATFVDPKSAQSGPFKNWLTAVGKSYASLYIKLAILALMTLLIMVVNQSEVFNNMRGEVSGLAKIFVIFGLLIFAKKAPKWIMDILGIKGDGMGLHTPSKLKDAMLGGALAAKVGRTALGMGMGAVKDIHAARKANRINRAQAGQTIRSRAHNAAKTAKQNGEGLKGRTGAYLGSIFSKEGAKENLNNMVNGKADAIKAGFGGLVGGAVTGINAGWNSESLKDLNAKTKANAKVTLDQYAPGYKNSISKVGTSIGNYADRVKENALGDTFQQSEKAKIVKDNNEALTNGMLYKNPDGSRNKELSFVNLGEAKPVCAKYGYSPDNFEGIAAALIKAHINGGKLKGENIEINDNFEVIRNGVPLMKQNDKGETVPLKASDFGRQERLYNQNGALAMESMARESAIEQLSTVKNNEVKSSQATQAIAAANNQILEFKGNVEATFGTDAKRAFESLEEKFNDISKSQTKMEKLQKEYYDDPSDESKKTAFEDAKQDYEAAKTTAESVKNVGLASLVGQGTADGIFASLSERLTNVSLVNRINEQTSNIKESIIKDINIYGEDSYYVPKTKDKSTIVNYAINPERAEEIIELMNFHKGKVDKRYEEATKKKD